MFVFNKFPILILSTPRTGSSAFGSYIQDCHNNLTYFNEPDFFGQERMIRFENIINQTTNYILKTHIFSINNYRNSNFLCYSNDVYRIRIRRKDFLNQVVSFYIAKKRNEWLFRSEAEINANKNDVIPIDMDYAKASIRFLKNANDLLENTDIRFDLDIFYEDLMLDNTRYYPTPQPVNYEELTRFFKSLL